MFSLEIPLTSLSLASIKADVRRALPLAKSSHRAEAIARGLGFKTNAALLAAVGTHSSAPARTSAGAFTSYLSQHGFAAFERAFFRAVARVAMRSVMEREPKLAWNGIGAGRFERRQDGRWESATENYARFLERRAELLDDHVLDEFMRAVAFLAAVMPTKTIRPDTNSYRLKHIAENFPCHLADDDELGPMYVSNGALIAAAIHLGFRHRTYVDDLGYDDPNVEFNMNKRQLDDLDCLYRPDGARAQDRARRAEMRRYGWPSWGRAA